MKCFFYASNKASALKFWNDCQLPLGMELLSLAMKWIYFVSSESLWSHQKPFGHQFETQIDDLFQVSPHWVSLHCLTFGSALNAHRFWIVYRFVIVNLSVIPTTTSNLHCHLLETAHYIIPTTTTTVTSPASSTSSPLGIIIEVASSSGTTTSISSRWWCWTPSASR